MRNTREDRPVYQRVGESWDGIGDLLSDVLQKKAYNWADSKGEEEDMQNIKTGVCHLPGAKLHRVLERGVR